MNRRAAAVQETRRRIVEAARELHTTQGIAATSWDDIAAHAGVGVGTVYRHFPTVDELIPACGEVVSEVIALPDPQTARACFAELTSADARLERLVAEAYAIYERGAAEVRVIRREPDVHPAVARSADELETSLAALVDAALEPLEASESDRGVVRAMIDFGTWQAIRDGGLGPAEAVTAVSEMLTARLTQNSLRSP
jgi:AcrR family transcriptional regulator